MGHGNEIVLDNGNFPKFARLEIVIRCDGLGTEELFALFQLFNAFNCRELHSTSIFKNLLKNKLMLLVVGCTFVLQILIIQFAGAFFGTIPLDLTMWLKLSGVSASVIVLSGLVKIVWRKKPQKA